METVKRNETKRNEMKWNRNETKVQSDICACAFRSSCTRLSEREHVSVKVCPSETDSEDDELQLGKWTSSDGKWTISGAKWTSSMILVELSNVTPTPAVHICLLFHLVSSIQLAVQP